MTHQPYQDWIFDDRAAQSDAQTSDLQRHLLECAECRQLSEARRHVESALQRKPTVAPAAGFTQRLQARMQIERQQLHRRQTRLALIITVSALVTLLAALIVFLWPWLSSLEAVFWAAVYQLYGIYFFMASIGEFMTTLLMTMLRVLPLVGWVLAGGMIIELGVLWVVSYRLLTNPRRLEIE